MRVMREIKDFLKQADAPVMFKKRFFSVASYFYVSWRFDMLKKNASMIKREVFYYVEVKNA